MINKETADSQIIKNKLLKMFLTPRPSGTPLKEGK